MMIQLQHDPVEKITLPFPLSGGVGEWGREKTNNMAYQNIL